MFRVCSFNKSLPQRTLLINYIALRIRSSKTGTQVPDGEMVDMLQVMPKKILIVEDNELNMKLFSDLLGAHGYDTKETREGLKAIKIAKKYKESLKIINLTSKILHLKSRITQAFPQ